MALTPMQYKSYVWPHNPRTYRITYQRQVAVQKVPFGRYALQNLGLTRRVMEGEGEFFGPEAYDEFRKLASVFYQEGPGMLIHPVWQSANVYFVGLALAQEPKQDYVRYTFTFWEDENRYRQKLVPVGQKKTPGAVSKPAAPSSAGNGGEAAKRRLCARRRGRLCLGQWGRGGLGAGVLSIDGPAGEISAAAGGGEPALSDFSGEALGAGRIGGQLRGGGIGRGAGLTGAGGGLGGGVADLDGLRGLGRRASGRDPGRQRSCGRDLSSEEEGARE